MNLLILFLLILHSVSASEDCIGKYNEGLTERYAGGGFYDKAGEFYQKAEKEDNLTKKKEFYLEVLKYSGSAIERFNISNDTLNKAIIVCPSDTHSAVTSLIEANKSDQGIIRGFMLQINDKLGTTEMQKIDN